MMIEPTFDKTTAEHLAAVIAAIREPMPGESWAWIPGYAGLYAVSTAGRVFSVPRPRTRGGLRLASLDRYGYPTVSLVRRGEQVVRRIHLLVAAAFLGPRPPGAEIRHLDGRPSNNHVGNLAYGSRSENMLDAVRHGTNVQTVKKTCPQSHPYDAANTYTWRGRRRCRRCLAATARRLRQAGGPK